MTTYMEGYFIYTSPDGVASTLHVNSEDGQKATTALRLLNGYDDT